MPGTLFETTLPLGKVGTVLTALLGIATPVAAVTFGLLAAAAPYLPFKESRNARY